MAQLLSIIKLKVLREIGGLKVLREIGACPSYARKGYGGG